MRIPESHRCSRREFVALSAVGLAVATSSALRAANLVPTPRQTEGPFYPDRLPLDQDNDLVSIRGGARHAKGIVTHLHGRIVDAQGKPVRGAVIEIWQCDANGVYLHPHGGDRARLDADFQGFGRFRVADDGAYRFRTIRPVSYPGRTPHIHVKVLHGDTELLTTQCYVAGDPGNERDGILRSIRDPAAKRSVMVDFAPKGDRGELVGNFDVVLGKTPPA